MMGSISTFCYETRHQILLFTLDYSYQLFINDIYDFFDCIINSTRRLFTNNFKIEGRVIRFSVIFLAMKMDSYNITEIHSQRTASLPFVVELMIPFCVLSQLRTAPTPRPYVNSYRLWYEMWDLSYIIGVDSVLA